MNDFNSLSVLACPRLCERERISPHRLHVSELETVKAKHQAGQPRGCLLVTHKEHRSLTFICKLCLCQRHSVLSLPRIRMQTHCRVRYNAQGRKEKCRQHFAEKGIWMQRSATPHCWQECQAFQKITLEVPAVDGTRPVHTMVGSWGKLCN